MIKKRFKYPDDYDDWFYTFHQNFGNIRKVILIITNLY
jgi:hypothetical protein